MPKASKLCFGFGPKKLPKRARRHLTRLGFAALTVLLLTGCRTASLPAGSADWDKYVADYLDAYFNVHPEIAVVEGRHEFDGELPDFSKAAFDKEIARLHSERERAAAFTDNLDQRQQFERDYVIAQIDSDLFWLESARWPYRSPYFYSDRVDPVVFLTRPYAAIVHRMRAFLNYEKALPAALESNSRESPNSRCRAPMSISAAMTFWRTGDVCSITT